MTITYAVKIDKTNPYLNDPDAIQYLAEHADPAIPYRKLQSVPAAYASLVKRDDTGEWEPVNGIDLHGIGMRAKHEIILKRAIVDGYGWARCICGWEYEENYRRGLAAPDYAAAAERHMADVDARITRFRELLQYVSRTPAQEACPHADDETRYNNPSKKEWRCRDCGLHIQWDLDIAGTLWWP
ncbi:hypothetical protein [Saccharomonospora sp.]|uniref:hypothetical protein n=1 Tax=Saccharomonospora sp. TaxID=33913 RepID=UPI002325F2B7|nr:hypothetical protein [Saccharomonospora sp.]MDA8370290.1 hypothetical protein [Nocardiopsaceae bacterium]